MNFNARAVSTASALTIAAALASPSAALAQYGSSAPPPSTAAPNRDQGKSTTAAKGAQRQLKLSEKAQPAIIALQTAVKAKNSAAVGGLSTAAQAVAKTPDDRYAIGTLLLQAAIDANDYPGLITAADLMSANGAPPSETTKIYLFAAQKLMAAKQLVPATQALDHVVAAEPGNIDALVLRSELLFQQQKVAESVISLSQAIDKTRAAGTPVPETWLQARVARAYEIKSPAVYTYAREWVAASPTPGHWRDAINIYRNNSGLERSALIDMFRLSRVTKALSGEGDYVGWAQTLINRGYPSLALVLLQEGAAGGTIKMTMPSVAQLATLAKAKSAGEQTLLVTAGKTALGAPTARPAMLAADGFFDGGNYAQAATLYRAALGKPGVDKDIANLRLGMALAMSGDKAGATTSLQAAGGTQTEIAKYWLTYVAGRA